MGTLGAVKHLGNHLAEGGKARPLGGHLHGGLLRHRRAAANARSVDVVLHGDIELSGLDFHIHPVHIGRVSAVQAVFAVHRLQDVEENLVLLGKIQPETLLQKTQHGDILRRGQDKAGLVAAQSRRDVGVKPPLGIPDLHRLLKEAADQAVFGIGAIHFQGAHVMGELLDLQHMTYLLRFSMRAFLRFYFTAPPDGGVVKCSQYSGNTVMIQATETMQRMQAGRMDCLIRDGML